MTHDHTPVTADLDAEVERVLELGHKMLSNSNKSVTVDENIEAAMHKLVGRVHAKAVRAHRKATESYTVKTFPVE